jgi:uncharacterized BrkB/YihY/UPF0761 family membrane protein
MSNEEFHIRRRLRFSILIIVSQMLLIALAISWLIHMLVIATAGSIYFVENNPYILWGEIIASIVIMIYAVFMLALQIRRLGERRGADRGRTRSN